MNGLPLGAHHITDNDQPPKKKLTRRQLFVRGALATSGLILAGAFSRAGWLLKHTPHAGLRVFSAREVAILEAVLTTLFPGAEGMPPADLEAMVPAIDGFLAQNDEDARLLFRSMLHVIEEQSAALRFTRFTRLSAEARAAEIRAWELTPIYLKKSAFRSLKVVAGAFYMEQPDTREAMGWYLGCSPSHLVPPNFGGAGV